MAGNSIQGRLSRLQQEVQAGNLKGMLARFSDLLLVAAVASMVGMMIVPLPTWLLDVLLTVNITAAVTILMVSIYISSGAQLASYPAILLITTLYRLSLDVSATRLILLQADAGSVIRSFGMFVVGGNFVVGAVIFLIITLVQFIVVTKGSERVAEVAARFTLDAMPGKQLSIDADLRAGIIDHNKARQRREALSRESQFYGAMDGAMKFVKGDAIAAIVITAINIVGGLIIGVAMHGMPLMQAVQTYSVLTIGNGLVSQIPALLISISAGMVVTRVASENESNLGQDVAMQILAQPKAIAVASGILFVMALVPGLPKLPFFALAAITGGIAYGLYRAVTVEKARQERGRQQAALEAVPDVSVTVPLVLEVGEAVARFADPSMPQGKVFYSMLAEVRRSLYFELGVIFPPVQAGPRPGLAPGAYKIWLNEVPAASGTIRTDAVLVNDSAKNMAVYGLQGEDTTNPANGKPAAWIPRQLHERALAAGFQVWDTHEVLVMLITNLLRRRARDFLGLHEVQYMVNRLRAIYPATVDEVVPKPLSLQQLTEILQRLADESVSIRNLKAILESLSQWARAEHDTAALAERVRTALKDRICYQLAEGNPVLYVYQLDPEIEEMFRGSIRQSGNGPYLAMDPATVQVVLDAANAQMGQLPSTAQRPVILTESDIRRFVRKMLSHGFPELSVLSYEQISPHLSVLPLGVIAAGQERHLGAAQ